MTTAVNSYIFYTQEDFLKQRNKNIASLVNVSKKQILSNALSKQQERNKRVFRTQDLSEISELIHNEGLLKGFNQGQVGDTAMAISFPNTLEAAMELLSSIEKGITNVRKFNETLNAFVNTVDEEYLKLTAGAGSSKYFNAIRNNFIANKSLGVQKAKGKTPEERIYETMMTSTYKGKAFSFSGKIEQNNIGDITNQSLGKIYTLSNLLSQELKQAGGISGSSMFKPGSNKDFWENVGIKLKGWIQNFFAVAAETAAFNAFVKGEHEFFKELTSKIGPHTVNMTGSTRQGVGFDVRFQEDPQLEAMFKRLEQLRKDKGSQSAGAAWNIRNDKTAVSDVMLQVTNGGVESYIGVSVKDYRGMNITADGTAYSFHTQSNTSLLTLLLREAGFTTSELITLFNIGATIPKEGKDRMVGAWEKIKTQVTYRAMFAALAGLDNTNDQIFYMALNGRLFTMQDIIETMIKNVDNGKDVAFLHLVKGDGLNRARYQEINKDNFVLLNKNNTKDEAKLERSNQVIAELMDLLQETKVNTSVSILGLNQLL